MGKAKFELVVKNGSKIDIKIYQCAKTRARWAKYYEQKGFKVSKN